MIDVSRYYVGETGDKTELIIEALDSNGDGSNPPKTIQIDDRDAVQLIKELFQAIPDLDQRRIAQMFSDWLKKNS